MLKNWFARLFKKSGTQTAEAPVWHPLVGESVKTPFSEIPEVYESVLFIASNATQAEAGFFRFKDNAEVYCDDAAVRPLADLLARPNPQMDWNTFLENIYGFLAYHREVFILKVPSRGQKALTRNLPAQLWPVNPAKCTALSYDSRGVRCWALQGRAYPAEEVIHIRYFNPSDMFRSVSPLRPLADLLQANKAAMKSNRVFYENNSQTPFVLATDKNLTKEEMKNIQQAWNEAHKGPANRGRTGFLSGGLKPYSLNTNSGTADFVENSKNTSERILAGLQMQKSLLNMTDTTNYATYMGQLRTFWQNVIRPMVRKVESALNAQVVRPYTREFELRFKYDNVEAFAADFGEKVNTAQKLAQMGWPLNAINDRLNLGFEPVPWGDEWWINFGLVPATQAGSFGAAEEEREKACACARTKSAADARKEWVWKKFDRRQIQLERLLAQKAGRFFMEQGSRLKRAAKNGTLDNFDWEKEDRSLEKMLLPVISDAVWLGINAGQEQLQKSIKDDAQAAAQRRYLGRVAGRISGINATTRRETEKVLTEGLTAGKSNEDIARELADTVLAGFKTRARLIARTESTGALNGGTAEYGAELGADKTWLTARDGQVRESHAAMDGETVGANGVFSNGLAYPGDPAAGAAAEEVCNCRCTILLGHK